MRPPATGVARNPLRGVEHMQAVEVGKSLLQIQRETIPNPSGLLVCKLNGEIVLRLTDTQRREVEELRRAGAGGVADLRHRELAERADNWANIRASYGDVIEWHDEPANREQARLALQVVVTLVATYFTANPVAGYAIGNAVAGVFDLVAPPRQPTSPSAEGVYSTSLSGNAARLDEPIPKCCGRVKVTPPYACLPYPRYVSSDPEDPNHNCDQYVYALLVVGVGNHEIEKAFIGRTPISHFQDVTTSDYLAPGVQPSIVKANTLISPEVSSSELDSKMTGPDDLVFQARYVGPIAGCRPGDTFTNFTIHVGADQGLGKTASGGDSESRTAQWQVEEGEIDDFGRPTSEPQIIASESRTDDTNTPQRWTSDYVKPAGTRGQARLVRTDLKGTQSNIRDGIQWIGYQVELDRPATLNAATAHYEIVMRSSDQLSAYSQRDFSLIVRGLCRTLDSGLAWQAEEFTRNPAWWLADLLTSTTWGMGLPDSRIDLQSIYDLAQTCDARQDHFDHCFASRIDAWEAAQLIARAARARVFHRNGLISVARDEIVDLPVAAFTPRNTVKGSMAMETRLPGREQADGILVQYLDLTSWDVQTIECPAPGRKPSGQWGTRAPLTEYESDLPDMENPVVRFYPGITGPTHVEREGLYDAADMAIRTTIATCSVEMEGAVIAYLDPVRWMPEYPGYGQSGDVAFWDSETLVMGLTEPPRWADGPLYLTLRRDDGTLTTPVEVSQGPEANDVILPAAPDFDLVLDAGSRERPQFLLGNLTTGDEIAKLAHRGDGGKQDGAQLFDLAFVVDDDRVHEADVHLLPGPGDIQDPIDSGTDYPDEGGGGFATLVRLGAHNIRATNIGIPDADNRGGLARYDLFGDGTAGYYAENGSDTPTSIDEALFPGEWLNTAPVDPSVAAMYEVYVDDFNPPQTASYVAAGAVFTGTLGSWLPLDADHNWSLEADGAVCDALFGAESITVALRVQIRRGTLVLATRTISLAIFFAATSGGGEGGGD